jgi:hypothetical protein
MSKLTRIVFLSALAVGPLLAQNTAGSGSITGTVMDSTGSPLPRATVLLTNPSRGIRRELETTEEGIFDIPSLPPAPNYDLTFSKAGFAKYYIKDIELNVGATMAMSPKLSVTTEITEVQVSTQAPLIEPYKTSVSQVIDSHQILDLPINGRRVDSFVLLTPGVTTDQAFGLITFRGNPAGNTFLTDGLDTTNQFYDENAGRTRGYNISQDAVQEFQVIASNHPAEYGRASGGVINTVTRSGSNDTHMTAYWFFRNRTLDATDPTANGLNPPEWRHQAGASIGGPIKKNKLFYFFNAEVQRRNFPLASSNIGNLNLFDAKGNYIPGPAGNPNCGAPATAAQCSAAISYVQSRVAPQWVPRTADVNMLFGRADYQINPENRLTLQLNYVDLRSPNGIQTQTSLTNGAGLGANANTTVFDRTAKAGLVTALGPGVVNEARVGLFKDRQADPASTSSVPGIGQAALSVGTPAIANLGSATNYPRILPSELRLQAQDTVAWTVGLHSFKFGFDYAHVEDYIESLPNQFGTYSYSTLTAFAQDFSGNTTGARNWNRYTQAFGNPVVDLNLDEFHAFAQDEYHVTPKLTISPGVRLEHTSLPQPKQSNPAVPETSRIPNSGWNFSPRLGIAYGLNEKTAIRASYGMFYNRYVTAAIENLFVNNGIYQATYTLNANNAAQVAAGPVFPSALSATPNVAGSANVDFADSRYRNAYSQQADIALERQLTRNTGLTVSYIWSRSLHITSASDANVAPSTSSYTYAILDPAGNQVSSYTTPLYTARINNAFGKIMELQSNANSYYNGLIVQLQHRYTRWFEGQAAYTYSHAIDYGIGGAAGGPGGAGGVLFAPSFPTSVFNGDERAEKGSSSNDERHRLVLNGMFSPVFTKGNNWTDRYLINGWQLSVISTLGSSFALPPTVSLSVAPAGLLSTSTLNGLGGSLRVPFESLSALNIAPIYSTDARISKTFPVAEKLKLQLMFEAFNVFNHTVLAGSAPRIAQQYFTVKYGSGIGLMPYQFYGAPAQTQAPPDGTTARRAQAVLRLIF